MGDTPNQLGATQHNELHRLNRAYRALSFCNGHIVRAASEQELLDALCETLVSIGGYRLAWIGLPESDTLRVRPIAAAGSEADRAYLADIHISWADDAYGRGPTGAAVRSQRPVINRDATTNPEYGPWRESALRHGFRSSIALPLLSDAQSLGVLMVYSGVSDAFDADEQLLLSHLADNLAFGMRALRAREALATLQQELRRAKDARTRFAILDDAPNGFMALDREGRVMYINESGARKLGHTSESVLGRVIWDLFPAAVSTPFWDAFQRAIREQEVVVLEEYFAPLESWFDVRVYPIETGVAAHFADISERKQLELTLRESEERFRQVTETIADVFWLSAPGKDRLYYVNPAYEKVWGRSRALLYEQPRAWLDALHPEDRPRIEACLPKQALGGWDETYRIVQPNGSVRFIRDRAYPVRDSAGRVHRIAGVARDITAYRRLEDQLRQAQKMEAVGRLAGGVAHDFNNMLSVILSYTGLMLDDLPPGAALRADVEEVHRAGERASDLTHQLLAFSRQQVLQPRFMDLAQVVMDMEKMLRRVLGEDVELSLLTAHPLHGVHADPSQVEQIVMNLIVNARDAMPQGGRLSIEIGEVELGEGELTAELDVVAGRYVTLAVADTGIGIDAATREHIFEPFFTTKDQGKGTGLGLSTVFGIVKQSGGYIKVESEPERGTTFTIYLPAVAGEHAAVSPPARAPATLRGDETILLVEDDEQVRTLARVILRRHGYEVLDAQNAGEALLVCEAHHAPISLLVTDMVMPRMSGRELAERLTRIRPELRVLYVSGYTEEFFAGHASLDESLAFLQKPITPETLLRKVREVLDA